MEKVEKNNYLTIRNNNIDNNSINPKYEKNNIVEFDSYDTDSDTNDKKLIDNLKKKKKK